MTVKITICVHRADEGGFWADVPSLPGCYSQAETIEELLERIKEAIACHLDAPDDQLPGDANLQEIDI